MMMFGNEQVNGVHTAFEVWAYRRDVNQKGVGWCWFYTQNRTASHQKRANVHRSFSGGRHPMLVRSNDLFHGIDKDGFWHWRHLQPVSPSLHASCVLLRSEEHDSVFRGSEGLHAFEQALAIIEDASGR